MVVVYKSPYLNHMTTGSYWVLNLCPPKLILFSVNTHVQVVFRV